MKHYHSLRAALRGIDCSIGRQDNAGQNCLVICILHTVHQRTADQGNLTRRIANTGMGMNTPYRHIKFHSYSIVRLPIALNTAVAICCDVRDFLPIDM